MPRDLTQITGPVCALTFDDGPSDTTLRLLELFARLGCTASFFVIPGKIREGGDEILRQAVAQGCTIENHSWDHVNFKNKTPEEMYDSYIRAQEYITNAVGDAPVFFRPPGLGVNDTVFDTIPLTFSHGSGGSPDWNSRPEDPATSDLDTRVAGILRVARDGHIYLLHDSWGNHLTAEAMEITLPKLMAEGYSFVNVRELFQIKGQPLTPGQRIGWNDVV